MSHITLIEHLKKINNLDKPHKGIVKDRNDPDKLYRVKVEIKGLIEGDTANLPWIMPKVPASAYSGGFINVPELDSEISVIFPYPNNPYIAFYDGFWVSKKNSLTYENNLGKEVFQAHYPDVMGWYDSLGNYFAIDKIDEKITLHHKTGTQYEINKDGDLNVVVKKDLNISIDGKVVSHSKSTTSIISDDKVILNMDILASARKTDTVKGICPIFGVPWEGFITGGNDKVKENI
jgi:hypothetical protein